MDDSSLVEVCETVNGAATVRCRVPFAAVQPLFAVGPLEHAAQNQLQEEVKELRAVVRPQELDDEIGVCQQQDLLLVHHVHLHAGLHDEAVAQALQGVCLACLKVVPELPRASLQLKAETCFGSGNI